jgi:hypothetical protein
MSHHRVSASITASDLRVLIQAMNHEGLVRPDAPQLVIFKKMLHELELKGRYPHELRTVKGMHRHQPRPHSKSDQLSDGMGIP